MSALKKPQQYTVEEFRVINRNSSDRMEYAYGTIYLIAPPTPRHYRIAHNIYDALSQNIMIDRDKTNCRVYIEKEIYIEKLGLHYRPDVLYVCDEKHDKGNYLLNPAVVFEVESKSTGIIDKEFKVADYIHIPTLIDLFLVSQKEFHAIHYKRVNHNWSITNYRDLNDEIKIDHLGVTLFLRDIYSNLEIEKV